MSSLFEIWKRLGHNKDKMLELAEGLDRPDLIQEVMDYYDRYPVHETMEKRQEVMERRNEQQAYFTTDKQQYKPQGNFSKTINLRVTEKMYNDLKGRRDYSRYIRRLVEQDSKGGKPNGNKV